MRQMHESNQAQDAYAQTSQLRDSASAIGSAFPRNPPIRSVASILAGAAPDSTTFPPLNRQESAAGATQHIPPTNNGPLLHHGLTPAPQVHAQMLALTRAQTQARSLTQAQRQGQGHDHGHGHGQIVAPAVPAAGGALAGAMAGPTSVAEADTRNSNRVFKLQFDCRRLICCSQNRIIVGWDFANGDEDIIRASEYFAETD